MSSNQSIRPSPFVLSTTVDFPDDLGYGIYTPDLLNEMMSLLKTMGVTRVYWNYVPSWPNAIYQSEYDKETLRQIGEPVKAAVTVAHRHGLELYATLKPYDSGNSATYSEGSPESTASRVGRIGGTLQYVLPFFERYPHTRVRRRQLDAESCSQTERVKRIRLLKKDDSPTRVRAENIEIWTSSDNYRYTRREINLRLKEQVEPAPREVRDYYSRLVTSKGAPVRTLTLDGFDLSDPYIIVTTNFNDDKGDFRNTALGMIEVYGSSLEPLPIVVAIKGDYWGAEVSFEKWDKMPVPSVDFRTDGLDFDSGEGPVEIILDTDNSMPGTGYPGRDNGVIAFARGKNEYLPLTPCEVYPEVRKLWSGYVDKLIEAGVDGIDVRSSSHSSRTDEPTEYGFNEPLLEEYRLRYGRTPSTNNIDIQHLAEIRGEHYTSFIREASTRVRQAEKKFQVHVHADTFRTDPVHEAMSWMQANIHFDWKTWLMEGLVDGITLRIGAETLESGPEGIARRSKFPHASLSKALSDPVGIEALALAQDLGVPVYFNRYVSRSLGGTEEYISDLDGIFRDDRFAGLDLYELASMVRPSSDGSHLVLVEDKIKSIRTKAVDLGLI